MRYVTLTLAMLGLLLVGTTFAVAHERHPYVPTASYLTTAADSAVVTPVRWYRPYYRPGWNGYYHYPPYPVYRPPVYRYYPPVYRYPYYGDYPYGFDFQYYGPRRSFSFAF